MKIRLRIRAAGIGVVPRFLATIPYFNQAENPIPGSQLCLTTKPEQNNFTLVNFFSFLCIFIPL